ncbi:hypothetical protein BRM70_13635, partial [Xanthomonas oryzae pv. oryzae]
HKWSRCADYAAWQDAAWRSDPALSTALLAVSRRIALLVVARSGAVSGRRRRHLPWSALRPQFDFW